MNVCILNLVVIFKQQLFILYGFVEPMKQIKCFKSTNATQTKQKNVIKFFAV